MSAFTDCVIPAAGASSRMGAWKPLLPWGSSTLVETTAGVALAAGCRVLLVLGNRGEELRARFGTWKGVVFVENPDWELGMLGSIQKALPLCRGSAFFTIPADMPLVGPGIYEFLRRAAASRTEPGPCAFFAAHDGRQGHPVLIPSLWIPEILRLSPGGMLKDFLAPRPRVLVEAGSAAVHRDLDTRADYETALRESRSASPRAGADPPHLR